MLDIDVTKIPPEGTDVNESFEAADLRIDGPEEFILAPGGRVSCHLERSDDGAVHVRGHLSAQLSLECSRCLEEYSLVVPENLDLFFLPETPGVSAEAEEEVELSDRDMVIAYYSGEMLHLGEVMREQILLAVPMKPLCGEACLGRCVSCGSNRNTQPCTCVREEPSDPRFAALKKLLDTDSL